MLSRGIAPSLAVVLASLSACSSGGGGDLTCSHDAECVAVGYIMCNPGTSRCEREQPADFGFWGGMSDQGDVYFWLDPSATATDVRLLLDGVVEGEAALGPDGWAFHLDVTELAEGTHYLRGVALIDGKDVYTPEMELDLERPPALLSQTPEPGATGVPVTSPVLLVFSEKVKVDKSNVSMSSDGAAVAFHLAVSGDGRTVIITPDHPEQLGHALSISALVHDVNGASLWFSSWFSYEPPAVTLTYPSSDLTTNGVVSFFASVSGTPEKVEVLAGDGAHINGVVLGTMSVSSGSGSFAWDTTAVAPGTYPVWLLATRGGWVVSSGSVKVTVTK